MTKSGDVATRSYELHVYEKLGRMVRTVVFHYEEGEFEEARTDAVNEAARLRSMGYNVYGFVNEKRIEHLEWI